MKEKTVRVVASSCMLVITLFIIISYITTPLRSANLYDYNINYGEGRFNSTYPMYELDFELENNSEARLMAVPVKISLNEFNSTNIYYNRVIADSHSTSYNIMVWMDDMHMDNSKEIEVTIYIDIIDVQFETVVDQILHKEVISLN